MWYCIAGPPSHESLVRSFHMNSNPRSALRRLKTLYRAARKDATQTRKDADARKCLLYMSQRAVFDTSNRKRPLTGALVSVDVYEHLTRIERACLVALLFTFAVALGVGLRINAGATIPVVAVITTGAAVVWIRVRNEIKKVLHFDHLENFMNDVDQAAVLLGRTKPDCLEWLRTTIPVLSDKAVHIVRTAFSANQHTEAKRCFTLFSRLGLVTGEKQKELRALLK